MYPYNTVRWDDTLSSIHTCRNQSKEVSPKLKWVSNLWMNVLVMVRGKWVLSSLIWGFFSDYFVSFVMSDSLNMPTDCPHTSGIRALGAGLCCVQTTASVCSSYSPPCSLSSSLLLLASPSKSSFHSTLSYILIFLLFFADLPALFTALACSLHFSGRPSEVFTC